MDFLKMCQYKLNIQIKHVHWSGHALVFPDIKCTFTILWINTSPITTYKTIFREKNLFKQNTNSKKNLYILPFWVPYPTLVSSSFKWLYLYTRNGNLFITYSVSMLTFEIRFLGVLFPNEMKFKYINLLQYLPTQKS